jgi:DNA polymerase
LAEEEWKLQAFRDFDTILGLDKDGKPIRKGHDLYKLGYARSFNVAAEKVTKKQRDTIGKTLELSMQFAGGVNAFITFALNFGIDLDALVKDAGGAIPVDVLKEAENFWDYATKQKSTLGLERDVFITCDALKRLWRRAHPNIVATWGYIEESARNAIENRGQTYKVGKLLFRRDGNWLRVQMPSGYFLSYPSPQVDDQGQISFMGIDQYTRKWQRIETFGGKLFENLVQGGARDIFMQGVVNADKAGYNCVMRIHDEQIGEVPDEPRYSVDELCRLMTTGILWAEGLPLAATGHEMRRYHKVD